MNDEEKLGAGWRLIVVMMGWKRESARAVDCILILCAVERNGYHTDARTMLVLVMKWVLLLLLMKLSLYSRNVRIAREEN